MAKRKTKRKTARRSSRRMSGAADGLMTVAAAVAGYVGGKMLSNSVLPDLDDKVKGAGLVAVGHFVLPMVSKSPVIKTVGLGMAIAGADMALRGFGVISGRPMLPMLSPAVNGMGDGVAAMTVAGIGDQGYTVAGAGRSYRRRYAEA